MSDTGSDGREGLCSLKQRNYVYGLLRNLGFWERKVGDLDPRVPCIDWRPEVNTFDWINALNRVEVRKVIDWLKEQEMARLTPEQVSEEQHKTKVRKLWRGFKFKNPTFRIGDRKEFSVKLEGLTFVLIDGAIICEGVAVERAEGPV